MIDLNDCILVKNGKQGNVKHYRMLCDGCGKDRGYKRKRYDTYKCRSCTKREKLTKPSNVDLNDRIAQSNCVTYLYKMTCINCSKDRGYLLLHQAARQCRSCSMLKKWQNGAMSNMKATKRTFTYIKGDTIINFKSSYELVYAQYLDAQDISWKYEPIFKLSDGTSILPDFQLQDGQVIEVKGYFRPDSKIKWDIFCSEYPNVVKSLLTKEDLKKLGLI